MSPMGDPDYYRAKILSKEELAKMGDMELIKNYIILHTKFKFPEKVKYPTIAVKVDKNTTVYPLEGETVITGTEYLIAKNLGCELDVELAFIIP